MRLISAQEAALGKMVTPETCMRSPTVHAIVTAVSRRVAVTPIHVYRKTTRRGRDIKEQLPSHPVARLLARPNHIQSRYDYWQDATSILIRYGRYHAYKAQGSTGPIRRLIPLHPRSVQIETDSDWDLAYRVTMAGGEQRDVSPAEMHSVRGPARDFVVGNSPIMDVAQSIALEILAEKFGATFFQNGAMPLLVFKYMQGVGGFKTPQDEKKFVEDFQRALGGENRFRAMMLPKGVETAPPIPVENEKAQFLQTRQHQRSVIAGALGVPPHLVGDLGRATWSNIEQQDSDFTINVILPICQAFESAMERDLLTDEDRRSGVVIRFNLDGVLRADFKSRQEGLRIQRDAGVISANEWREIEGKNPISPEDGGDDYMRPANFMVAGDQPEPAVPPQLDQPEDSEDDSVPDRPA